jgi:hypothetical protein
MFLQTQPGLLGATSIVCKPTERRDSTSSICKYSVRLIVLTRQGLNLEASLSVQLQSLARFFPSRRTTFLCPPANELSVLFKLVYSQGRVVVHRLEDHDFVVRMSPLLQHPTLFLLGEAAPPGLDAIEATARKYLFYFAAENSVYPDYVSEKLFRALRAGAVPIYLGSPTVADFAPAETAFLQLKGVEDVPRIAEEIKRLTIDRAAYEVRAVCNLFDERIKNEQKRCPKSLVIQETKVLKSRA